MVVFTESECSIFGKNDMDYKKGKGKICVIANGMGCL